MTTPVIPSPQIAVACGGTGGHLFPGLAVASELRHSGCEITLLVSEKEIDQVALRESGSYRTVTLPAVGLQAGTMVAFARGFAASYRAARSLFRSWKPDAVLAMGGFTSAPPILAGKRTGARIFLHESNTIPGRANRWLSRVADRAFVGFPDAANRLRAAQCVVTGTPVRAEFQPRDKSDCKVALGFDPKSDLLLVMGGSQGASWINKLLIEAAPLLAEKSANLQILHLTGKADAEKVRAAYSTLPLKTLVCEFLSTMNTALGAATLAISRAGASSLAEMAAMRVPCLLIPFPAATDNHQWHNAAAFAGSGAALLLEQKALSSERLADEVRSLLASPAKLREMSGALAHWHTPDSAARIAHSILELVANRKPSFGGTANDLPLRRYPAAIA